MGKKPALLAAEHAQIVALQMERLSERQMEKRLQSSKSLKYHAIEKCKKHEIYDDMKKTGRPVKLLEEMDMSSDELCDPPLILVVKYFILSLYLSS